jgi:hypothetical protein
MLLNFRERTPKRTDRGAIELLHTFYLLLELNSPQLVQWCLPQNKTDRQTRLLYYYGVVFEVENELGKCDGFVYPDALPTVQSTAHHNIHSELCNALISRALALILNCKCIV